MFRNLNPAALGLSGRQSELIELVMNSDFRGLEVDMVELAKRSRQRGGDYAARFLLSAKIQIGSFELPINWRGSDADFRTEIAGLPEIVNIASSLGATRCYATIQPASDEYPYHENFEIHRKRLYEIGDVLGKKGVQLGIGLLATQGHRTDKRFEFIYQPDALLLLIKAIGHPNVGLLYDSWNWYVAGGTLAQIRGLKGSQIAVVHLADAPSDVDRSSLTDEQRMLPGAGGSVDTTDVITALNQIGYDGPITVFPHASQIVGRNRELVIQSAAKSLDAAFAAVGLPVQSSPSSSATERRPPEEVPIAS